MRQGVIWQLLAAILEIINFKLPLFSLHLTYLISYDLQATIITREVTLPPQYVPSKGSGSPNELHVVGQITVPDFASIGDKVCTLHGQQVYEILAQIDHLLSDMTDILGEGFIVARRVGCEIYIGQSFQ